MIRVRQVKIRIENDNESEWFSKISKKLRIQPKEIETYEIIKKSIDARDKDNIYFVYEFNVKTHNEDRVLKHVKSIDVFKVSSSSYCFRVTGEKTLTNRIVIVGSGPAGLFCAYFLAEAGYRPIILERGEKMEDRIKTVEEFFSTNKLNVNSNIQFGEGGAGTFSDGKLNTLVKDKAFRGKRIFEILVENGAPKEILYLANPHVGTDLLRKVIVNIRNKIISMGGEFYYSSILTDIIVSNNELKEIEINYAKKIPCEVLVLALGHSARDTFSMLYNRGVLMNAKSFAVGIRIMHPQKMISESQYGKKYKLLPPANYKLTYQASNGRGVYSFCMCPGGFVVNASSEKGRIAINGMSNYKRDSETANSAIVVTVMKEDFGEGVFAGVQFQRELEAKAYSVGMGNIPVQLYKDFVMKKKSESFGDFSPNVKGNYNFADLNELFPNTILKSLKEAIPYFGTKIKGFDRDDAILFGVESRTSSPIIMKRDEMGVSNILGIYPCGEGAGYAGGITTAAIDGVKTAEKIAKRYKF